MLEQQQQQQSFSLLLLLLWHQTDVLLVPDPLRLCSSCKTTMWAAGGDVDGMMEDRCFGRQAGCGFDSRPGLYFSLFIIFCFVFFS